MIKDTIELIQNVTPLTVVSHGNIRNQGLRSFLLNSLRCEPGDRDGFLAEPFFESMFPWETVPEDLDGMVNANRMQPGLREAIRKAAPNVSKLRTHQSEALEAIRNGESIVVTTGTSSGKTECFLYPILDQLASELGNGRIQPGVRALFLYPLNALIESQRKRFEALCSGFGANPDGLKKIRFALYNGRTKGNPDKTLAQMKSRKEIRAEDDGTNPPHLLVTNSTMLEYALVRPVDRQIFSKSQHLRYVVLDEAHTYLGSDAAEMAMRLRRTLDAFGVRPGDVQFIATSATVSGPEGSSQLQEFLAKLGGVDPSKVRVIGGCRRAPTLMPLASTHTPAQALEKMRATSDPVECFRILNATAKALDLREKFQDAPRQLLGTAAEVLGLSKADALEFLDLASTARSSPAGDFFLPLKAHLFQRSFAGVWACTNPGCAHRQDELNNIAGPWPYGKVWLNHPETRKTKENADTRDWTRCDCGSPVFQVVYCGHCGEPHLAAQRANGFDDPLRLTGRSELELLADMEQQDVSENDDDASASAPDDGHGGSVIPVLLHPRAGSWNPQPVTGTPQFSLGQDDWVAEGETPETALEKGVCAAFPGTGELRCDRCHSLFHLPQEFDGATFPTTAQTGLRGSYLPSKAVYQALVDRILRLDVSNDTNLPLEGRKLLGFTDSRQGTAYNAAAKGLLGEMDATRIWLFNAVLGLGAGQDPEAAKLALEADMKAQADASGMDIAAFKAIPMIKTGIEKRLLEIESASSPSMEISQAHEIVKVGLRRAFAQAHDALTPEQVNDYGPEMIQEFFHIPVKKDFDELARLFVWRELVFRSRRKRSLESLGMLSVQYQGLDNISDAPAGLRIEHYRSFLKIMLDFAARRRGALELPGWNNEIEVRRCFGESIRPKRFLDQYNLDRYDKTTQPNNFLDHERLTIAWLEKNKLDAGWDSLRTLYKKAKLDLESQGILSAGLVKSSCIRFSLPKTLWICPNTGVLLERVLGGFSPYTVSVSDRSVTMLPSPEGFDAPTSREDWESIRDAIPPKEWWTDIHQRILDTTVEGAFPIVQEHSAQLESEDLERHQKSFEDGRINILNCSTTMEMGVDIGDVSLVAMTNVPPYAHNYLQRAGRVGRGDQGQSLAWTVAGIGSHEQGIWEDPMEWVGSRHSTPHVSLESRIIVQRHLNSWLLARWLRSDGIAYSDDFTQPRKFFLGVTGLPADVQRQALEVTQDVNGNRNPSADIHDLFHKPQVPQTSEELHQLFEECIRCAPIQSFLEWLESPLDSQGQVQLLAMLVGTALENASEAQLRAEAIAAFAMALQTWEHDAGRLILAMQSGISSFRNRMGFELRALGKKQTIGYLSERAVLPMSGMPTEVVTCSLSDLTRDNQVGHHHGGEDGKGRDANGYPSRPRPIAIREFAPGSQIILDGMVHTIEKIVMNWKPVAGGQFADPQSLRDVKTCVLCGATWISSAGMGDKSCPECGHSFDQDPRPISRSLLIPSGFLAAREGAHKNVENVRRSVVERPHVGLLPNSPRTLLGDGRTEVRFGRAVISHMNGGTGPNAQGEFEDRFRICLKCGEAAPWPVQTNDPLDGHDKKGPCTGASVKTVSLGALEMTDALAIRLPLSTNDTKQRIATSTWAVALREQVADICGIRAEEIGWAIRSGSQGHSAILYDTAPGGANFCSSAKVLEALPELLRKARERMASCHCESVCHHCLLRRDVQYGWRDLNRLIALEQMDESQLKAMALPEALMLLGKKTRLAIHGAVGAIRRELGEGPGTLTIPLHGDSKAWEPEDWPLLESVRAWLRNPAAKLEFVVPQSVWDTKDKGLFKSLLGIGSVLVGDPEHMASGVVLADLRRGDKCVRWVACSADQSPDNAMVQAGVIGGLWGNGGTGLVIHGPGSDSHSTNLKTVDLADLYPSHLSNVKFDVKTPVKIAEFGSVIFDKLKGFLPTGKITKAHYSDRYLFSPLQFRVLRELLQALDPQTIQIDRQFKESGGYWNRKDDPYGWTTDYPMCYGDLSVSKTDELIRNLFIQPENVTVKTCTKGMQWIPHNRLLTLETADGQKYEITSHFGVSGWKILTTMNLRSPHEIPKEGDDWLDRSVTSIINASFSMIPTEPITFFIEKV